MEPGSLDYLATVLWQQLGFCPRLYCLSYFQVYFLFGTHREQKHCFLMLELERYRLKLTEIDVLLRKAF